MRANTAPKEIRVKTVERSLALLEIMAEQNIPLSLTRIGKLAHLNLSTAYRLLNALCSSGFIEREQDTGHYRLGLKAFLIGNAVLPRIELREVALPYLNRLMQSCGETNYLAILSNQNVIYTDCVKTSGLIYAGIQTGIPVPACQTSSGRILIANLPKQEQFSLVELYAHMNLIKDQIAFFNELSSLLQKGFSAGISNFEETIREISVPVYNYTKRCVGAISVFRPAAGPDLTEKDSAIIERVKKAAAEISQALGYSYFTPVGDGVKNVND